MMTPSQKKLYLNLDLLAQGITFGSTLVALIMPPIALIGLFFTGAVQLFSCFLGAILFRDPVRWTYLGGSLFYLFFIYFMTMGFKQTGGSIPGGMIGFLVILMLVPPFIGAFWYLKKTQTEFRQAEEEAKKQYV